MDTRIKSMVRQELERVGANERAAEREVEIWSIQAARAAARLAGPIVTDADRADAAATDRQRTAAVEAYISARYDARTWVDRFRRLV